MDIRPLGTSGLSTPPLVLGGNVFGWTADEEQAFRIMDRFVGAGGTMIDTADVYSVWAPGNEGGESERIIGKWLKRRGRRDDVLIATKIGFSEGLSVKTIEEGVNGSLDRLGVDHIDLYYAHKDDPEVPLAETLGAFHRLVEAGKVRAIGASQIEAGRLAEALDVSRKEGLTGYSVLQTWYSLMDRQRYEGPLSALVRERGLGMLAFYGLANGYLTGKYRAKADLAKSVRGPRVRDYVEGNGPRILAALDEVSAETGATLAQIALAWIAAQPAATAPIASARTEDQVEELIGAMTMELTEGQIARVNEASG